MNTAINALISIVLGSTLMINGVAVDANQLIDDTKTVVNQANVHQLVTALEIYYLDHNAYPNVSTGTELIDTLQDERIIRNRPLDPEVFEYTVLRNGQDFDLTIK